MYRSSPSTCTATKLSDRNQYPYFFRTVPSDNSPAQIFYELATKFGWYYVAIIYSDCIQGRSMKAAFMKLLTREFCVRIAEHVKHEDDSDKYRNIISTILHLKIRIVYLFLGRGDCEVFLKAAEYFNSMLRKLTFIIGPSCGTLLIIPSTLESYVNGLVTIGITNPLTKGFAKYFQSLNPGNTKHTQIENYFKAYWVGLYGCTSANESSPCNTQPNDKYNHLAPVRPVIEAVYAIANSLRRALKKKCKSNSPCYNNLSRQDINELRETINKNMLPVDGEGYVTPRITKDGDVTSDYHIYQFQSGAENVFVTVGEWNYRNYNLLGSGLHLTPGFHLPNSTCSVQCGNHEIVQHHDACPGVCWKCKKCEESMILSNNTCIACNLGYKANSRRDTCLKLPINKYINITDMLSIVVIAFSSVCLIAASIILFVYLHNYDTPIIKATSRELALFSLGGLVLMFMTPVFIVLGPSVVICCLQKIMFGLSLTCCYAPLMLKTNRIYRIFMSSQKFKLKKLTLVSTTSLFLLIFGMIGVQLVMGIFWIMTDLPMTLISYPKGEIYAIEQCHVTEVPGALNILFPVTLMIASTFWAFKTRNLPEEFSEIKSIGATMYITLFSGTCALALIAILKQTAINIDYYIICFTYQLVAVVTLIGQYAMKVKILYWDVVVDETIPKADCPMTGFAAVIKNPSLSPRLSATNLPEDLRALNLQSRRGTGSSVASSKRLASPKLKRFSIDFPH